MKAYLTSSTAMQASLKSHKLRYKMFVWMYLCIICVSCCFCVICAVLFFVEIGSLQSYLETMCSLYPDLLGEARQFVKWVH